jgi:hypothetical protein
VNDPALLTIDADDLIAELEASVGRIGALPQQPHVHIMLIEVSRITRLHEFDHAETWELEKALSQTDSPIRVGAHVLDELLPEIEPTLVAKAAKKELSELVSIQPYDNLPLYLLRYALPVFRTNPWIA